MKRQEESKDNGVSIVYEKPTVNNRIYASIVDYCICFLLCLLFVFSANSIVKSTDYYKETNGSIDDIKLASHLYEKDAKGDITIITLTKLVEGDDTANSIKLSYDIAMMEFLEFSKEQEQIYPAELKDFHKNMVDDWYKFRLTKVDSQTNLKLFEEYERSDGTISIRETGKASATTYIELIYKPYIKDYASKQLLRIPTYFENTQKLATLMLSCEIPIPVILSILITFYIPGLCFKRGRKSFGKAIFKIGLVGPDYYNVSVGRYTLRSLLILLETALFVPAVISFTIMTFGKKQTTIHDLILKCTCVNTKGTKVYYDKLDAFIDQQKVEKKPVDFKIRGRFE